MFFITPFTYYLRSGKPTYRKIKWVNKPKINSKHYILPSVISEDIYAFLQVSGTGTYIEISMLKEF